MFSSSFDLQVDQVLSIKGNDFDCGYFHKSLMNKMSTKVMGRWLTAVNMKKAQKIKGLLHKDCGKCVNGECLPQTNCLTMIFCTTNLQGLYHLYHHTYAIHTFSFRMAKTTFSEYHKKLQVNALWRCHFYFLTFQTIWGN